VTYVTSKSVAVMKIYAKVFSTSWYKKWPTFKGLVAIKINLVMEKPSINNEMVQ